MVGIGKSQHGIDRPAGTVAVLICFIAVDGGQLGILIVERVDVGVHFIERGSGDGDPDEREREERKQEGKEA